MNAIIAFLKKERTICYLLSKKNNAVIFCTPLYCMWHHSLRRTLVHHNLARRYTCIVENNSPFVLTKEDFFYHAPLMECNSMLVKTESVHTKSASETIIVLKLRR
jgi:hypothetical protein